MNGLQINISCGGRLLLFAVELGRGPAGARAMNSHDFLFSAQNSRCGAMIHVIGQFERIVFSFQSCYIACTRDAWTY